jgi:hypothetical protein
MRSITHDQYGEPAKVLRLEHVTDPRPPEGEEVLIRVVARPVNTGALLACAAVTASVACPRSEASFPPDGADQGLRRLLPGPCRRDQLTDAGGLALVGALRNGQCGGATAQTPPSATERSLRAWDNYLPLRGGKSFRLETLLSDVTMLNAFFV